MKRISRVILASGCALALLALCRGADAQAVYPAPAAPPLNGAAKVTGSVIDCFIANMAVACPVSNGYLGVWIAGSSVSLGGGGGGSGGAVTQSTGSSSYPWWMEGLGTAGSPSGGVISVQGVTGGTPTPISAASLPLPAGAASAANQPALNVDGGALAHITNLPTTQPVTESGAWTMTDSTLAATLLTQGIATGATLNGAPIMLPITSTAPNFTSGQNGWLAGTTYGGARVNFTSTSQNPSAFNNPSVSPLATVAPVSICSYNSTPYALTTGQTAPTACDSRSVLLINPSPPQQTMQPPQSVPVAANNSTTVWTHSGAARSLKLVLETASAVCRVNDTGGAASATVGWLFNVSFYVWNLSEPPPNTSINVYCTSAATFDVSEGD